jgi:hypothetical protein
MDQDGFRTTTPADILAMKTWLSEHGAADDIDIVMEGETPADDAAKAAEVVAPWAEVGCTWWLDSRWGLPHHSADRARHVTERLEAGPPRLR